MQYLIVTEYCYMDEFYMPGIAIISEKNMQLLKDNSNFELNCYTYLGSGGAIKLEGTIKEFLSRCTITKLTDEQVELFKSTGVLGRHGFLGGYYVGFVLEILTGARSNE